MTTNDRDSAGKPGERDGGAVAWLIHWPDAFGGPAVVFDNPLSNSEITLSLKHRSIEVTPLYTFAQLDRLRAELESLRAANEALRRALGKYGRHEYGCNIKRFNEFTRQYMSGPCTCGLSELLTSTGGEGNG